MRIALFLIRRQEHPSHRVVVSGDVVIQPGDRVIVLPRVAFVGVHAAGLIALVAVGAVELVAEHGGAACRVAEGGQDAAEGVGHEKGGRRRAAAQFAEEMACQAVVVRAALLRVLN